MKISQFFYRIPYKKYIAGFLIAMILVSQTIHVSFFDSVLAGPENYRDIVSIIVDKQTYTVQRNRILQYASDIAGYLGGVRTSILVVDKDTPVETIAAKNEQLYYEGDGDKGTSSLVGTVLIGNIPIPIVEKDGVSFSSLYPYVDFVDKSFTYDPKSTRYKYNNTDSVSESVEIWHGVMNPAVGRNWDGATDIVKIGTFLDKTHDFYTKSGKFAPSLMPPKVFYYDGLTESKSIDARGLFAYGLSMKNAENIAYNRFTKYLLRDISTAFQDFDVQTSDPETTSLYASLGIPEGSDSLSEEQIKKIPDIQTKDIILGLLKNFKGIFNEKSLGEELLAVHNAGRYTSGATVSADIAPISISLMDDLARATLKTSNRALATSIDRSLESGIASKIILFDKNITTYTGGLGEDINDPLLLSGSRTYKGYYFGMQSEQIANPSQCTIARGYMGDTSQFGRSVLVEANAAFDIGKTEGHISTLKSDTETLINLHRSADYGCFNTASSTAKLMSYWGDNSVLKIMGTIGQDSSADSFLFDPSPATTFKGFSSPIFSLGGMKESSRISNPSIANCMDQQYQYSLLQPYLKKYRSNDEYGPQFYTVAFPYEWNTGGRYNGDVSALRYTCNTQHVIKNPISIASSISEYTSRTCFVGKLYLNGAVLKEATASCIQMEGFGDDMHEVDKTQYEDRYYHTIPSVWSHISPTDDEIAAAKANGMTPSLPIDQIRYVEFLTPKGNVARINYPNFFEFEGNDIASVRNWLKTKSTEQWNTILNKENSTPLSPERALVNQKISPGILPISPIDWNTYVSDDMIEQIIQSKNWLHPDISLKYKRAIESMLSYSHVNSAVTPKINTAPKIPSLSNEYEIAYLGLPSSFGPDFSRGSSSTAKAGYDTRIREIEGANISDESIQNDDENSSESECGPPDGVPLLEWPSAIMCWIKAQFPPRILAGSCGPSTIGIGSPLATPAQSPSSLISGNNVALTAFYNGSRVIPHLPRSSLQLRDGITINLDLQKNNTTLSVLPDTVAHLEIVRGTTGGKNISYTELGSYLTIAPNESPVGEKGANFVLNSVGNEAQLVLKGYYIQKLPDGSEIRTNSEEFQISITPEYYSLSLEQSGSDITSIDVTSSDSSNLKVQKILKDGTSTSITTPIIIEVIDDISGNTVYTGSSYIPGSALPTTITKKIGVYRIIIRDTSGISGEMTFAVQSGIFSQIRIVPISSALVKGTKTIAMIRLLDRLGNPTSPNVHSLKLDVTGGYIVDSSGDKKTSMNMDIIESQVPILIGSDSPGVLGIKASVDEAINTSKDITIYDTARIVLMRDRAPQVGGTSVPVHIEIQDATGKRITGLSSVASWKFPDGAGSFSKETITITDGLSESFEYLPGTVAGNHSLSIDIPGVGSLSDIVFSLLPGVPLYASHTKDSNSIVFSLRDRYDNVSSFSSLVGTLSRNNSTPQPIVFSEGIYRVPLQGGEYTITVPGLKNNSISYTEKDTTGKDVVRQIFGIDIYVAYISGIQERLDFAPDYNARYTILAGGSFLREGEDILYDTIPGQSQSLAVSTILENPYKENILVSLFPGGSYALSETSYDSTLEASISLQDGFPLLSISDLVTHKQVAKVIYRMQNAGLETCKESSSVQCNIARKQATIRLVTPNVSDFTMATIAGTMQLNSPVANILNIQNNGVIRANNGVTFVPKSTSTLGLEMGVIFDNKEIARLIYITDSSLSVEKETQTNSSSLLNTPVILNSGFSIQKIPGNPLNTSISGYKIFRVTDSEELDETKNGPGNTDSLGALSEISGVGWQGNNTMLLAYAGGDTVGETTRFFHTYTLVNLGDPIAHVDHGRPGTEKDGIDRTLGSMITRGTRSGIVDVYHRDMDSDGILDLVVLYQDGYMELFLNHGNKFRTRGMITYNKDFDSKKVSFGDFTHDGYGDIIGVNTNGDFILVDNSKRKFSRLAITLDGGSILPKNISQFNIYDMDTDSLDDIVYITAGGELGILYGTQISGNFVKKILDSTLGITLSDKPITVGGAIKTSNTPDTVEGLGVSPTTNTGIDDSMLKGEVFYQYSHPTPIDSARVTPEVLSGVLTDIADGATGNRVDIFVRSQYVAAYGLSIEKKYTNTTHPTLYPDDLIQAKILIKNTTNQVIKNIEYLDSIPKIFSLEKTQKYSVTIGGTTTNRQFESLGSSDYDMYFIGRDLAPGETMEISYDLIALPASYGEMIVGDLEKGTVGADVYGDVGFKTSTTCGANMLLWASDPVLRTYTRGTHEFGDTDLPDGLATRLADGDNNGTPDSIENMSLSDKQKAYKDMMNSNTPQSQALIRATQDGNQFNIGFDDGAVNSVIDMTQNLLDGLSCGFGGGSCLNFPLNWAPLAPGSSPTLFGIPLIPTNMTPLSGIPIFAGLTICPGTPPFPGVWPGCPFGAGGIMGPPSISTFRIFFTPTLTLGMGTAMCFGPNLPNGMIPPPGISPLVPGGNCIVVAKSMPVCKGDGSDEDGNVSDVSGLGTIVDTWNATSCHPEVNVLTEIEDQALTTDIVSYLKNPDTKRLNDMYTRIARRGPPTSGGPFLKIGNASSGDSSLDIEIDSNTKISDIGSVIKLKNKRIAAFPDFLMDWLTRQTDEITNSLFTPPNLTIIPPSSFGQNAQVDGSFKDFSKNLGEAYSTATFDNVKQGMATAFNKKSSDTKGVPDSLKSTAGNVKGTLGSIKSAYTAIGKLPFISVQQSTIPLNIPWINKSELDKYARSLEGYKQEIDNAANKLCIKDTSPACLAKKASLKSSPFVGSVIENLKRIEEYKRFPMKIQKYITWKERYIAQVLCNINIIQQITGGWLRDNGIRFRKWAELFVLIKAIAEGWQPLLDIFTDTSKNCGVCRNERNNLQYWKFKLLSMLIPSIPVIKFPKWPDIILDLSDIRFGISISMPNFDPRISPIRLPDLPSLSIGDFSASLGLPALFLLPRIPPLPDLPDLPSLPKIKLPNLPPPPKLPKIAGSIAAFLKIMKLISKMYCFYQKTFLVPEWQAGDIIAQRTERQGTMPFDFINLNLPQFSLPSLKEIRVGSHVNYSMRSEFISEFARTAVKPVNSFQTDLKMGIPKKIGEDVNVQSIKINKKINYDFEKNLNTATGVMASLFESFEKDKDVFLDIDEFTSYIMNQLDVPEFTNNRDVLKRELRTASIDAIKTQNELLAYNDKKFNLLKEYVASDNDDIAKLQNIMNLLNTELAGVPRELIADTIDTMTHSTALLNKFNDYQNDVSIDTRNELSQDGGLDRARVSLQSKLSRLVAANESNGSSSTSQDGIAAGYSPHYQGIYIRTPSGVQTQLFDYISPLRDDTRVDTIDIDKDGDKDYIYILDGVLYVKYSWKNLPNKINDTTIKFSTISPNDVPPYVPDYFHENLSTPKNLNFSFVPAYQDETAWRLEFYDRYIEWDHVDIGDHDSRISPKATVDMFTKKPSIPIKDTRIISTPISRSLESVRDKTTFALAGRSIEIYTGALSISMSPGRILYTGRDSIEIKYTSQANISPKSITLNPYTGYEFSDITEITTTGGKLYLIGEEDGSRYSYSDDLVGVPILSGMQIYGSDAGAIVRDHISRSNISLAGGAAYMAYNLGDPALRYEVSIPYVNGYYYARLQNLTKDKSDRAGVILLAPQASSDDGSPIVDLPSRIRLPIYSTREYKIADILTDLSPANITIDNDLTTDTNNDGISDNDFAISGSGFEITAQNLKFGKFTVPGKYNMMLKAIDDMGNITIMPLIVEAYTLIPQIQNVTNTGTIVGNINEVVSDTPVHFFRVRPGEGPTILSPLSTFTSTSGQFATGSFYKKPEIITLKSNIDAMSVNNHGVFSLLANYHIDIVPATEKSPMKFLAMNESGSISHIHSISLPDNITFIDTSKINTNQSTGVLMTPVSGSTRIVPASSSDVSIPGGIYITDMDHQPLAAIARDGNIYILDTTTTLRYASKDGYLMIELVRANIVVASISYRIDFFYTMK